MNPSTTPIPSETQNKSDEPWVLYMCKTIVNSTNIYDNLTITNSILYKNLSELNELELHVRKEIFEKNFHGFDLEMYAYILMFIFGLGNFFVLISLCKSDRKSRRRENFLFINLSLVDLLIIILIVPIEVSWNTTFYWTFGGFMCKLFPFLKNYLMYLSSFITVIIAYNRYQAFVNPFSFPNEYQRNKRLIIIGYLFCFLISFPLYIFYEYEKNACKYNQCVGFNVLPKEYHNWYNLSEMMFFFIIPVILILYFYFRIVAGFAKSKNKDLFKSTTTHIRDKNQSIVVEGEASKNRKNVMKRARKSVRKMAIMVPAKFIICWLPHFVMVFLFLIDEKNEKIYHNFAVTTCFKISLLNCVLNPWLLSWYQFKKYLKRPVRDKSYFCWPDNNNRMKSSSSFNQNNNHHLNHEILRSDSLKQINYKVNLKTLDSHYKPHFLARFINYLTNFGQFKKKSHQNYDIETNTAHDSTVRTVRAVLNESASSVCSCQANSSSINKQSLASYNSNSSSVKKTKDQFNSTDRCNDCHYCRAHQIKLKINNDRNYKSLKHLNSPSISGSHSGSGGGRSNVNTRITENTTSETSRTNSTASRSSIAATAVYFVCCIRDKKKNNNKNRKIKCRRRKKTKKLTRKCCIKYNRPGCLNSSSYFDSQQQSQQQQQNSTTNNSNELNCIQSNQFEPKYQLESLKAHQPNCTFKDKFYSTNTNKFNLKHDNTDYEVVGKANDLFSTCSNGVNIGLGNFNGKIKMKINNCHLTTNSKINGDNKCFIKKNLINELTYREHTNTIYLIDSDIVKNVNNNKIIDNEIDNNNNNNDNI